VLLLAADAQRVVVPLDLGWRTSIAPAPACSYPTVIKGYLGNSGYVPTSLPASAAACEAAACAANVQAWSFCEKGECGSRSIDKRHTGPGPWCIIGSTGRILSRGGGTWTTKARDVRQYGPAAATAASKQAFDDSAWEVVDLPHDASITLPYSQNADGPQGFQPVLQTFYRKHFRLPSAWKGMAITLVSDGAIASSSWWVNGKQLIAMKTDGYLPAILRLDNVPGLDLTYGNADNVIAVWTDNSASTGWWYEGSGRHRSHKGHARKQAESAQSHTPPHLLVSLYSRCIPSLLCCTHGASPRCSAVLTVYPLAALLYSRCIPLLLCCTHASPPPQG
jgi:hypothetical protein